ncbi:histidine kinase, partial [Candidatus Magnetomorum sp. HK-1]
FEWIPHSDFPKTFVSNNFVGDLNNNEEGKKFKDGKKKFVDKDFFKQDRYVTLWHRKNMPEKYLNQINLFNTLFYKTKQDETIRNFTVKESNSVNSFDEKRGHPYIWISFPIVWDNRIHYLFNMDNRLDIKRNSKIINVSNIQLLETFCMTASSIMENVWKRNRYFEEFHSMLAHAVNEPFNIVRSTIPRMVDEKKSLKKRKRWAAISISTLKQVHTLLNSFVVLEKGNRILKPKNININKLLRQQISIFEILAENNDIKLLVNLPEPDIYCHTDEHILMLILNNLLGNAFQYTKASSAKKKKIQIQVKNEIAFNIIRITNDCDALPEKVKNYLRQSYYSGLQYPTTGFGIGFSRDMANMLLGDLRWDEKYVSGVALEIILYNIHFDQLHQLRRG